MKLEGTALVKVELQLIASDACYEPSLSGGEQVASIEQFFKDWLQSYVESSQYVARVDGLSGDTNPTDYTTLRIGNLDVYETHSMLFFNTVLDILQKNLLDGACNAFLVWIMLLAFHRR